MNNNHDRNMLMVALIWITALLLALFLFGCSTMTPIEQEDYEYSQRMLAVDKTRCVLPRYWDEQMRRCMRALY